MACLDVGVVDPLQQEMQRALRLDAAVAEKPHDPKLVRPPGGLPLRLAVGTTLTITALSSAVSFVKHSNDLAEAIPPIEVDWRTIGLFIGVGVLGRWIGHQLGSKVNHLALTRGFSYFLAAMAAFILVKELAFAAAAR